VRTLGAARGSYPGGLRGRVMSIGHNGIAADQLKAFVERIERLNDEIAALNTDKSEIYAEAKGSGSETKDYTQNRCFAYKRPR